MIKIGNHEWRTLRQPIIAQSKVVKEVWINDQDMVYPEGTYLKMRASFKNQFIHYHDGALDPEIYRGIRGYYGPANTPIRWNMVMVGVAIFQANGNNNLKLEMSETINDQNFEKHHEFNMYGGNNWQSLVRPHDSFRVKTKSVSYRTTWRLVDAKVKFRVDPLPVCGPYRQPHRKTTSAYYMPFYYNKTGRNQHTDAESVNIGFERDYYGNAYAYRTYIVTPTESTIIGPSEFNERIFMLNPDTSIGELPINQSIASEYTEGGSTTVRVANNLIRLSAVYPYEVKLEEVTWPIRQTTSGEEEEESDGEDETITEVGYYYRDGEVYYDIPYKNVMFLGPAEEASQEDMTISDDDLDLDSVEDSFTVIRT